MKRTPLKRRTGLSRGKPPQAGSPGRGGSSRTKPRSTASAKVAAAKRPVRAPEPGEAEWKRPHRSRCAICGRLGRVVYHHAVVEQEIRRATTAEQQAAGIVYDLRWAIPICAPYIMSGQTRPCHDGHHHWSIRDTRLSFARVMPWTRQLAVEVLGEGPAENYWRRYYAP